jgi:hypothetical protein
VCLLPPLLPTLAVKLREIGVGEASVCFLFFSDFSLVVVAIDGVMVVKQGVLLCCGAY